MLRRPRSPISTSYSEPSLCLIDIPVMTLEGDESVPLVEPVNYFDEISVFAVNLVFLFEA